MFQISNWTWYCTTYRCFIFQTVAVLQYAFCKIKLSKFKISKVCTFRLQKYRNSKSQLSVHISVNFKAEVNYSINNNSMSSNYSMSSTSESSKSGKSMNFLGDLTKPLTSSIMQVGIYTLLNNAGFWNLTF